LIDHNTVFTGHCDIHCKSPQLTGCHLLQAGFVEEYFCPKSLLTQKKTPLV